MTEEITSPGSISPHSQRTDSVFESTHPDSEFEDEDPTLVEDIGLPVRASSVMEYKDRVGSVDSGGTIERRSMSYHDISDVHMQQYGYRSHLPIQNYGYVQVNLRNFDFSLILNQEIYLISLLLRSVPPPADFSDREGSCLTSKSNKCYYSLYFN